MKEDGKLTYFYSEAFNCLKWLQMDHAKQSRGQVKVAVSETMHPYLFTLNTSH